MFFGKKKKKNLKCENCSSSLSTIFSFCPYCGNSLTNREKEKKEFGMLGKMDANSLSTDQNQMGGMGLGGLGISDKMISSIFNKLMKTLGSQFNDVNNMDNTEVSNIPNGIKIRIGVPKINKTPIQKKSPIEKQITDKQIKKMAKLPRTPAKTTVKRLSNKVIYELTTPGLSNKEDVFISKLESGYEIKAIGSKKVYVNNIPISLPLKNLSLLKNKLLLEFHTPESFE